MNILCFTILICYVIKVITNNEIIQLNYSHSAGTYYWKTKLGSDGHFHYFTIDLKHDFNYGSGFKFLKETSNSIETISIDKITIENTFEYTAMLLKDSISLTLINQSNINLSDFYFYDLEQTGVFFIDSISLAQSYRHSHLSIMHMLKDNKYINSLSFAFVPDDEPINDNSNLKNGILCFGGIPYKHIHNKQKASCKTDNTKSYWSCVFKGIQIGNKVKYSYNNTLIFFHTNKDDLLFPTKLYDLIVNELFSKLYINNICKFEKYTKKTRCNCLVLDKYTFPKISIYLNGMVLVFEGIDNIFYKYKETCIFFISPHSGNKIIIGTNILQQFITEFNMELNEISIYSDNHIKIYSYNEMNYCKIILCSINYLLCIVIIYDMIVFIYKRK